MDRKGKEKEKREGLEKDGCARRRKGRVEREKGGRWGVARIRNLDQVRLDCGAAGVGGQGRGWAKREKIVGRENFYMKSMKKIDKRQNDGGERRGSNSSSMIRSNW